MTGELQALAKRKIFPRELCGILTNGWSFRLVRVIRREVNEYSYTLYKPHDLPVDREPKPSERRRFTEQVVTILAHMISISEHVLKACTSPYRAPQSLLSSVTGNGGDEADEDGDEGGSELDQHLPIQDLALSPPPSHNDKGDTKKGDGSGKKGDHHNQHGDTHNTTSPPTSPSASLKTSGEERQPKMQPNPMTFYEEYMESFVLPLTAKNLEKYAF